MRKVLLGNTLDSSPLLLSRRVFSCSVLWRWVLSLSIVSLCVVSLSGCLFGVFSLGPSHAQRAQQLRQEGKFEEAITEYRLHMELRRKDAHRPPDENPAFYELLIGDVYLDANSPLEAEESYQRASDADVHGDLVNFKFRHLGQWYESQGNLEKAIQILKKYRDRDPLMFDYDIDRLHKAMLRREDEGQK